MSDPVNHPSHYTYGKFEVIDVIEDAVIHAPCPQSAGSNGTSSSICFAYGIRRTQFKMPKRLGFTLTA